MINILIVDDSAEKIAAVREVAEQVLGKTCQVATALSVAEGYAMLQQMQYDVMILDLHLPSRPGELAAAGKGVSLLRAIRMGARLKKPRYVVGFTAFDELLERYRGEFERDLWTLIKYDPESTEWLDKLAGRFVYLAQAAEKTALEYDVDIAIVVALEVPELEAVLALPCAWKDEIRKGDSTIYHRASFAAGSRAVSVVASAVGEAGMAMAAAHATKVLLAYRPRYLAMVGIAAGVAGSPGDVIVADQVWDYGSGKRATDGDGRPQWLPAPAPILVDVGMKARYNSFARRHATVLAQMETRWKGELPQSRLAARIGGVASGAAVVADRLVIEEAVSHNRKLLGIEMEAYGICCAARVCPDPKPSVMIIKSVSDHADARKDDRYQKYAAFTSSEYLYAFCLDQLVQ